MKILICDDHAIFREGLRSVLAALDASLVDAATCDEALVRVETEGADLVLLDLTMPGTDGWTALRKLRSGHPDIPVIIVSASEELKDVERALDSGASGFIPKSSTPEVLRAALQLVLSGGIYIPPAGRPAWASVPRPAQAGSRRERRRGNALLLTPRQLEVLNAMARGLTNREIAGALKIAEATVKAHVVTIFAALDVTNRTEAALVMREIGLEPPES